MFKRFLSFVLDFILDFLLFNALFVVFASLSTAIYSVIYPNETLSSPTAVVLGSLSFGFALASTIKIKQNRKLKRATSGTLNTSKKHYHNSHKKDYEHRAEILLYTVQLHCSEINNSTTVYDFYYSWKELVNAVDELIWLNEKKRVKMTPPPRKEWKRICSNLNNIINDFLDRAAIMIPLANEARAVAIEKLLGDVVNNHDFYSLFSSDNKKKLKALSDEAHDIRCQLEEQEKLNREIERREQNLRRIGLDPCLDLSDADPFLVADILEERIKALRKSVLIKGASSDESWDAFLTFKYACESSTLPLAAEIRLEDLLIEYEPKFKEAGTFNAIDKMTGLEFEHWCAGLLLKLGFKSAEVTRASGDDGVDIIATKDGLRYAIQCKRYNTDLGNSPVQAVHTGKTVYHCHVGAVMTNRYFTSSGKKAAEATEILLWDRDWIAKALEQIQEQ